MKHRTSEGSSSQLEGAALDEKNLQVADAIGRVFPRGSHQRRKRVTGWNRYQFYPLIAVVIIVLAWHVFVEITKIKSIYLPSPASVLSAFSDLFNEHHLLSETAVTLARIYGGFIIATILGVGAGLLMNLSRGFRSLADAFIAAFYPLPKIALIPLLIIWLGSGESYKLVISVVSAFFPIVVNTYLGVRQVDRGLIKAGRDLGLKGRDIQRKIILPSALPSILAGLHLGIGISVVMVVAAEMVAGSNGLGYQLLYAGQLMKTEAVFALLIVLTVLGWATTKFQHLVDRLIAPWSIDTN